MADEKISALPAAGTLDGTEPVPVVKGGVTKQTTTQAIADLVTTGNANITPITAAALQALAAATTISTTTLYVITDASAGRLLAKGLTTSTIEDGVLNLSDGTSGTYVLGTDVYTPSASVPNLQQVTDVNNTTTNNILVDDGANNITTITAGGVTVKTGSGGEGNIKATTMANAVDFELPNKAAGTETFAMLSDIGITDNWESTEVSSNITSALNNQYINTANATYTDPSPTQAKGYLVYVRNGTATIGGVGYSAAGSSIWRVYHSGAWASYYNSPYNDATSSIQTQLDAKKTHYSTVGAGTAVTGSTSNLYSNGLLIPAGTFTAGDVWMIDCSGVKTGTAGTLTMRIYANTVNSLAGSPILISTSSAAIASTRLNYLGTILAIEVANGTGVGSWARPATTAGAFSWGAWAAVQSVLPINWVTQDQYIVVSVQLGSGSDSANCNMIYLH